MLMFYKYILYFMIKIIVLLGGVDWGLVWIGCFIGYIWWCFCVGGIIVFKIVGNFG